jgi:hypothetical protein
MFLRGLRSISLFLDEPVVQALSPYMMLLGILFERLESLCLRANSPLRDHICTASDQRLLARRQT